MVSSEELREDVRNDLMVEDEQRAYELAVDAGYKGSFIEWLAESMAATFRPDPMDEIVPDDQDIPF